MNTVSRDFVTVDMQGLKAPLAAVARRERKGMSELVRVAVSHHWALEPATRRPVEPRGADCSAAAPTVKVAIRMTRGELEALDVRSAQSGLSRGVLVAGLLSDVPALKGRATHREHLAALIASNAELATLTRDIARLCTLLEQQDWQGAREYVARLGTLLGDVRSHLAHASAALRSMRPRVQGPPSRSGAES
jgi:hypothetical protein